MKKLSCVVVGFGDRGQVYSSFAKLRPALLEVVAVVEPNDLRRNLAKNTFNIKEENCFTSLDSLIKREKLADFAINATMDNLHIETSIPLIEKGYDLLLEKPISNNKEKLLKLYNVAKACEKKVIVCHVLRYTDFYLKIKQIIDSGELGEIRHIEASENVGVAHASISFIRGKWNNSEKCGSTYLLQKCCHDFDLLCWLNNCTTPSFISSMGGRNFFIPEKAPNGAGTRCLLDCQVEKDCPYSAKKLHIDNDPMGFDVWRTVPKLPNEVTKEEKIESLKNDNPHGVCIFKTDANLVDQQSTIIKYDNGSTAYFSLYSSAAKGGRRIMVYGTKGELEGFSEDGKFKVRLYNPSDLMFTEKIIDISDPLQTQNHMGGDVHIMEDLVKVLNGLPASVSTTSLADSINSHLCVFAADESLVKESIVRLEKL